VLLPLEDATGEHVPEVATGQPPGDVDLDGLKVLVVDDEPDVLDLLSRILTDSNAQVHSASNAAAALARGADVEPDVLVSDVGMPEIDGFELLTRLRRQLAGSRIPAIAVTAFTRPEDRQRTMECGFDEYLTTPVDPRTLIGSIAALAASATARKAA
jgi:CheY-like chemotaxis protein